jgi:hypothetical protein
MSQGRKAPDNEWVTYFFWVVPRGGAIPCFSEFEIQRGHCDSGNFSDSCRSNQHSTIEAYLRVILSKMQVIW